MFLSTQTAKSVTAAQEHSVEAGYKSGLRNVRIGAPHNRDTHYKLSIRGSRSVVS